MPGYRPANAFQKPLRINHSKLLNPRDRKSLDSVFRKQMFLELSRLLIFSVREILFW
jgi:hypothetical protein